jgi:hypothetical protein
MMVFWHMRCLKVCQWHLRVVSVWLYFLCMCVLCMYVMSTFMYAVLVHTRLQRPVFYSGHGLVTTNARHLDKLRVEFSTHGDIAAFFGMESDLIRVANAQHRVDVEDASDRSSDDHLSHTDSDKTSSSPRANKRRKVSGLGVMLDARFVKMTIKLLATRMDIHLVTSTRNLSSVTASIITKDTAVKTASASSFSSASRSPA